MKKMRKKHSTSKMPTLQGFEPQCKSYTLTSVPELFAHPRKAAMLKGEATLQLS